MYVVFPYQILVASFPALLYFAPGGQKQWVAPGDGANISCFKLSYPQASQMHTFTHPAQPVPVSPLSIATLTAERNFRNRRYLKPPVQLCPLSGTSNSVAQRSCQYHAVMPTLWHITAPLKIFQPHSPAFSLVPSAPDTHGKPPPNTQPVLF